MFVIAGDKGCAGIVFRDRAELEDVIKGLNRLKDDEIFIDKPLLYCRYPKEISSDDMMESYKKLLAMVESSPWEISKEPE